MDNHNDNSEAPPPEVEMDPHDLKNLLIGFMGQTYKEVSKFDNNLISSNASLAPKKTQFQRTAEKLVNEVEGLFNLKTPAMNSVDNTNHINRVNIQTNPVSVQMRPQNVNNPETPIVEYDPNQMEFNFSSTVTSESIKKLIEDLHRKIDRIEDTLDEMKSSQESVDNKS